MSVVAVEYQQKGIGRAILRSILDQLVVPKVIPACVHGQEEFYRRVGFLKDKSVMALYENSVWLEINGLE